MKHKHPLLENTKIQCRGVAATYRPRFAWDWDRVPGRGVQVPRAGTIGTVAS